MKMFNGLFFKPNVDIIIDEVGKRRRHKLIEPNGTFKRYPTLYDMESVTGQVIINLGNKKDYEHKGIKLELFGTITGKFIKEPIKFISLTQELESATIMKEEINKYRYCFQNVQKQYESFRGTLITVRYFLRLTIDTQLRAHVYEEEFAVINPEKPEILEEENLPIKMEVGIEDWLHLVFDIDRRHFGLKDVLEGRVSFMKVGLKLNYMELQIIKKETVQFGGNDTSVISTYEIMDGAPVKNEIIPIRLYLKPYELSPTMNNVNNKFSTQYFVNLVLTDDDDRKYFKQHEIFLHRIEKIKKPKAPFGEEKTSGETQKNSVPISNSDDDNNDRIDD